MKANLKKFKILINKNVYFVFLISSLLIIIFLTQIFNSIKETRKKNFFNIINNIYFEKTLSSIFKNLDPKYLNIEHKIKPGDTFDAILKNYEVPLKEINKIKKTLAKKENLNKLKKDLIIKFTIDSSDSIKIVNLIYPVSRTVKIKVVRDGLIIRHSFSSGLLLPQVPIEYGWNTEEFLQHTCEKAGLARDMWKNESVKIEKFEGIIFKEETPNGVIVREET